MLRAYIEEDYFIVDGYLILAMMNIAVGAREDRKPNVDLGLAFEPAVMALATMPPRSGQEHGEFREFSTTVMAVTIRNAIDSLAPLLAADPKMDLKFYAKELATTFDRATGTAGNEVVPAPVSSAIAR